MDSTAKEEKIFNECISNQQEDHPMLQDLDDEMT